MTGARDPHCNEWPLRLGLMSLVVVRERGDWSIAVSHNMDLPHAALADAQAQLQRASVGR